MDDKSSAHGWVHSALAETCPQHGGVQIANYDNPTIRMPG